MKKAVNTFATIAVVALLLALVAAPVRAEDTVQRVVFVEDEPSVQMMSLLAERGVKRLDSVDAFGAHLVQIPADRVEELSGVAGVRHVVENVEFDIPGPPEAETGSIAAQDGFTTSGSVSVRMPQAGEYGTGLGGEELYGTVHITSTGMATAALEVEVTDKVIPEGAGLADSEPGPEEFSLQWDGDYLYTESTQLPDLLLADQHPLPARFTLGEGLPAGEYSVTKTVTVTVEVDEVRPDTVADVPWHLTHIEAHEVWDQVTGLGIKVAVMDTGIDPDHPELQVEGGAKFTQVNDEVEETDDWGDEDGHGTAVAGVLAASLTEEGALFSGAAPDVKLYSIRSLEGGSGTLMEILAGLEWARDEEMQVVNMSFGTENGDAKDALCEVLQEMSEAGIVLVASAGNDPETVKLPAACEYVIAAGATTPEEELAGFSGTGPEMAETGLMAPGTSMFALDLYEEANENRVRHSSGTSFSAPLVSGAAALLLEYGVEPDDVYKSLADNACDLGYGASEQGAGLINANCAVTE